MVFAQFKSVPLNPAFRGNIPQQLSDVLSVDTTRNQVTIRDATPSIDVLAPQFSPNPRLNELRFRVNEPAWYMITVELRSMPVTEFMQNTRDTYMGLGLSLRNAQDRAQQSDLVRAINDVALYRQVRDDSLSDPSATAVIQQSRLVSKSFFAKQNVRGPKNAADPPVPAATDANVFHTPRTPNPHRTFFVLLQSGDEIYPFTLLDPQRPTIPAVTISIAQYNTNIETTV